MKRVQRMALTGVMVAMTIFASGAAAQAVKQVPSDALFFVKIRNLQQVSAKIGQFAKQTGVADLLGPQAADPLTALEQQANVTKGLKRDGDLLFVYLDPARAGGDEEKSMVVLLPVSDYNAFLGNFNATAQGDITEVTFPDADEPVFSSQWGDYAAISPSRDVLAKKPEGLNVQGLATRELDTKDFIFYANMEKLRTLAMPALQEGRQKGLAEIEKDMAASTDPQKKKYAPVAKAALNQLITVAEGFMRDAESATMSITFAEQGLQTTMMTDFKPGTYGAQMSSRVKNSDEPLLAGLPTGKYIMFGGFVIDSQLSINLLDDLAAPVLKELNAIEGEDQIKTASNDYYNAIKGLLSAADGQSFGMFVPSGQLGQEPILKTVNVTSGDAKAIAQNIKDAMRTQEQFMSLVESGAPATVKTTLLPDKKTVDGVEFEQFQTQFEVQEIGEDATPEQLQAAAQARQANQFMTFLFGPEGQTALIGSVSDKSVVTAVGLDDATLKSAIATARSGDAPLGDLAGVKAVSPQLPKQRIVVGYIAVDSVVTSALDYAKMFGFNMPIQLPPDVPPVGFTIATEGSAVRADSYVPAELVQNLVTAGLQAYMMMMQGGGGGGGMMP